MTHYEVLGVSADASPAELRRAYVDLARRHHPDFHSASGDTTTAASELRIRQINAAWETLGSPERRAAYDRQLAGGWSRTDERTAGAMPPKGPRITRPSTTFTPYFAHDEDDDDSWRYEPDEVNPATVPPKILLAAPAACFVGGIALLAFSAPTGSRALIAGGAILLILSAFLFVGTPIVAMFKSQMVEERARRARSSSAVGTVGPSTVARTRWRLWPRASRARK